MKMKENARRRSGFWRIYAVLTVVLAAAVFIGLWLFWKYIAAYEASQPIHAAEAYAASLTEEALSRVLAESIADRPSPFESAEDVRRACGEALCALTLDVQKMGGGADAPHFALLWKDRRVGEITLTEDTKDKYGFPIWKVVDSTLFADALASGRHSVRVSAPEVCDVFVNGVRLEEEYRLPQRTAYPVALPFEMEIAQTFCITYAVTGLYGEPQVSCLWQGVECPPADGSRAGEMQFLLPPGAYRSVVVSVPNGSEVRLNGVAIPENWEEKETIAYAAQPLETGLEDLPYEVRYTVNGLLAEPALTAVRGGEALPLTRISDGAWRAEFPADALYRCTISVPAGAEVTMRAQDCASYRMAETAVEYAEFFDDPTEAPRRERYVIESLFLPPQEPTVRLRGRALTLERSEEGRTVAFTAEYPRTDAAELCAFARNFVDAYFTYTSMGFNNTDENLRLVLEYVRPGSDLEARLRRSLIGFVYVTPVTADTRTITTSYAWEIAEDTWICPVRFAVEQDIYSVHRSYSGTLTVCMQRRGDSYQIRAMLIEND